MTLPAASADQQVPRTVVKASSPQIGGQFWVEGSYLYWATKGDRLPALVTQGGTGVLGDPATSVVFGNSDVNDGWRSGARVRLGYWFDPGKRSGIDVHAFMLGNRSTGFAASSNGTPLLALPFFDPSVNAQNAAFVAAPGLLSGQVSVSETSRLYGAGGAYRRELCGNCAVGSVIGLVGYRYLRLRDALDIAATGTGLGFFAGASLASAERFEATNDFHGFDIGLSGEILRGAWSFEWMAKVAVGATLTDVSIGGSNAVTFGGVTAVTPGFVFAQPSNIGAFERSRFSTVPEASIKLGYKLTTNIQAFVGYDVMYWTGVVRPGGTIDTTVNSTQIAGGALVGAARPAAQLNASDFWAHGASVGVKASF